MYDLYCASFSLDTNVTKNACGITALCNHIKNQSYLKGDNRYNFIHSYNVYYITNCKTKQVIKLGHAEKHFWIILSENIPSYSEK